MSKKITTSVSAAVAPQAVPKPLVISYLRFSTPEQSKGDSRRRQLEQSDAWASARGLAISDNNRLSDLGISAFRGKNAKEGALGEFLRLIQLGKIPKGSTLLVESLDRLSRDEVRFQMQQFLAIINNGVNIVTLGDGSQAEYSEKNCDLLGLMQSLMIMSRANEESATKAARLRAAWKGKRATAKDEPLTKRIPTWLTIKDGEIVAVPEKAAVVKEVFRLSISGYGAINISTKLNNGSLPCITPSGSYSRKWVIHTLQNRSCIGEYQPTTIYYENGTRKRRKEGEPIKGYFPSVVTEQEFYAAQNAISGRRQTGGKTTIHVNLFNGLLYSIKDGSTMVITDKGRGAGRAYTPISLVNGCKDAFKMPPFPVVPFEQAVLFRLAEPSLYLPQAADKSKEIALALEAACGELATVEKRISEVQDTLLTMTGARTESIIGALNKMDEKREALTVRKEELQGQLAATEQGRNASGYAELFAFLEKHRKGAMSNDERMELRNALRKHIERIDCQFAKDGWHKICGCKITLKNGEIVELTFKAFWVDARKRDAKGHCVKQDDDTKSSYYRIGVLNEDESGEQAMVMMSGYGLGDTESEDWELMAITQP